MEPEDEMALLKGPAREYRDFKSILYAYTSYHITSHHTKTKDKRQKGKPVVVGEVLEHVGIDPTTCRMQIDRSTI